MTNWQAGKYDALIALQNDVAKNSLWRSAAVNCLRNGSSATTRNKGKAHVPLPSYTRPQGSIGHNSHGSHNNLEVTEVKELLAVN